MMAAACGGDASSDQRDAAVGDSDGAVDAPVLEPDAPADPELAVTVSGGGSGNVTSSPAGIDCSGDSPASCTHAFTAGTVVTLTAEVYPGSVFGGWTGACTGTQLTCQVTLDQARSVGAQFDVVQYTLQVTVAGAGSGSVASPGGIDCGNFTGAGTTCAVTVPTDTVITLTATAQNGSAFTGWTGACSGLANPCMVPVQMAVSVTASFAVVQQSAPLVSAASLGGRSQGQIQGLGLDYYIAAQGVVPNPTGSMNAMDVPYVGQLMLYAGSTAPAGWIKCNGALLSTVSSSALFNIIGDTFGGNGVTTFAVPDLRDRAPIGVGTIANAGPHPTAPGTSLVPVIGDLMRSLFGQGQPEVVGIHYYINVDGQFPGNPITSHYFVGQMMLFAGGFAPAGWHEADGSLLPISGHTPLFSIIGTKFGGDGTTTFGLPDLRARVVLGTGSFTPGILASTPYQVPLVETIAWGATATGQVGTLGLAQLIVGNGVFPTSGTGSNAYTGQIIAMAGNFVPDGWFATNGSLVSISTSTALFSVVGTPYGGNGSSNFGLPNLRARAAMGSN